MSHPYARTAYVAALADRDDARIVPVEAWRTAVLVRRIEGGGEDAAGAYPMAALSPDGDLREGLAALARAGLVSAVLVADPLFGPSRECLATAFDLARPFKTHHLVDPTAYAPSRHHRQELRRSARRCEVEIVRLADHLSVWAGLYAGLIARHGVTGPAAFSPAYWRHLAAAEDLTAFAARVEGQIAAMGLWFEHEGVAYNHLGASGAAGYAAGASYALYDAAIAHFVHCRVLNLGGGAGLADDVSDGLFSFKQGFATGATQAWLYGKVLDPARYATLGAGRSAGYFPAYRS